MTLTLFLVVEWIDLFFFFIFFLFYFFLFFFWFRLHQKIFQQKKNLLKSKLKKMLLKIEILPHLNSFNKLKLQQNKKIAKKIAKKKIAKKKKLIFTFENIVVNNNLQ